MVARLGQKYIGDGEAITGRWESEYEE